MNPASTGNIDASTHIRCIDWPQILATVRRAGLSTQQIADECEISPDMLDDFARAGGSAVRARLGLHYWAGHCLVALWCARCGRQLRDVPITSPG